MLAYGAVRCGSRAFIAEPKENRAVALAAAREVQLRLPRVGLRLRPKSTLKIHCPLDLGRNRPNILAEPHRDPPGQGGPAASRSLLQ